MPERKRKCQRRKFQASSAHSFAHSRSLNSFSTGFPSIARRLAIKPRNKPRYFSTHYRMVILASPYILAFPQSFAAFPPYYSRGYDL